MLGLKLSASVLLNRTLQEVPSRVAIVYLDRMNYHHADWVYRKYGLEKYLQDEYFDGVKQLLFERFKGVEVEVVG